MFEGISNVILIVLWGLFLGVIGELMIILEIKSKNKKLKVEKREGESDYDFVLRTVEDIIDRERHLIIVQYRKAYDIMLAMIYVVSAIMIIVIYFTPVRMNWLAFFITFGGSASIMELLTYLVKAGKISVKSRLFNAD